MKNKIKRGIYLNIIFLFLWIALAFINYSENKGNFLKLFYITIIGEIFYWATILIVLYLNKVFKN